MMAPGSPKSRDAKMGKLTTQSSTSQTQNYMCNDTRNASRETEKFKRQRNYMSKLDMKSCFPGGSDGKESSCSVGDLGSILGLGRSPGGGHGNPFQYSCLENPHGQRSLEGYSLWGRKESDTTEQLRTHRI